MYKQKAQQELQRVCTKAVPDCLPSTTSIAEKRKCHHFHNYYVLDLYDRLIGQASVSFANLVQTGEHIEDNHKTEKIEDYQTPFDQSFGGTSDSRNKNLASRQNDRNETEVHTISAPVSQYQHPYASPAPIYQLIAPPPPPPTYHMVYPPPPPSPPPLSVYHHQQQYPTNCPDNNQQHNHKQRNPQCNSSKVARNLTPLPEPVSQLYQKLWNANLVTPVQPKPMTDPLPKKYDQNE